MVPLSLAVALAAIVGALAQKYAPILGTYVSVAETVTDKAVASTRVVTIACGSPLCTSFRRPRQSWTCWSAPAASRAPPRWRGIDLRLQPAPAALEHSVVHGRAMP